MKASMMLTALLGVGAATQARAAAQACSSDEQCQGNSFCVDGICLSDDPSGPPPVPDCASDTDCPSGAYCIYGVCDPDACKTDADCGAYTACELWSAQLTTVSAGSASTDASGGSSGGSSGNSAEPAPPPPPEEEEEVPTTPEVEYGHCALVVETVPADPSCAKLCELLAPCVGVEVDAAPVANGGGAATPGSTPADPDDPDSNGTGTETPPATEETETPPSSFDLEAYKTVCTAICSYGVLTKDGADEAAAALSCVAAQPSCEAINGVCEADGGALDAFGGLLEDAPEVESAWEQAFDGGGATETKAGTDPGPRPEDGTDPATIPGTNAEAPSQSPNDASAGCAGGHSTGSAWLFAALALIWLGLRSRASSSRSASAG
jgi:hypothetical protein